MKVLITGICGFVGKSLALELKRRVSNLEVFGLDNLSRSGSEQNRSALRTAGIRCFHGDLRNPSDLEDLTAANWVIDAAANPSVLAGVDGRTSSRQLLEHNLGGTLNVLEYCKRHGSGIVMLSTSRVYSQARLSVLPVEVRENAFVPRLGEANPPGISADGVDETFSTEPPLSLYGAAKLASEVVALEYGATFGFPVHLNRCGVLAGAGQFGRADQGIFSFWIHSYRAKRPLKYIGFEGRGYQVRDCLHPSDLAALVSRQLADTGTSDGVLNVSGGIVNSMSLAQLSAWCADRFGSHPVTASPEPRRFDVPWLVLESSKASLKWNWKPEMKLDRILEEIARNAEEHPEWLDLSAS